MTIAANTTPVPDRKKVDNALTDAVDLLQYVHNSHGLDAAEKTAALMCRRLGDALERFEMESYR